MVRINIKTGFLGVLMVGLAVLPPVALFLDNPFYIDMFSRVLIYAIAAVSLNLILGYGGMVSFGHAVYLGVGGYVVGISIHHATEDGIEWMASGWFQFPAAALIAGAVSLVVGAICLRTKGVYFIMITLAFSQMFYFTAVGLVVYGADDGMPLLTTSEFSGLLDLSNDSTVYYIAYFSLLVALYLSHRIINSRFGRVISGARSNERRMQAIGFPTYRYRLTAFVIAGAMCGFAGALLGNQNEFISPSMMTWLKSGDLIIIVVLGGMGTLFGPVVGAVAFLFLEEFLSNITENWQVIFGPMLVLVVIFARGGIMSWLTLLDARIARKRGGAGGNEDNRNNKDNGDSGDSRDGLAP